MATQINSGDKLEYQLRSCQYLTLTPSCQESAEHDWMHRDVEARKSDTWRRNTHQTLDAAGVDCSRRRDGNPRRRKRAHRRVHAPRQRRRKHRCPRRRERPRVPMHGRLHAAPCTLLWWCVLRLGGGRLWVAAAAQGRQEEARLPRHDKRHMRDMTSVVSILSTLSLRGIAQVRTHPQFLMSTSTQAKKRILTTRHCHRHICGGYCKGVSFVEREMLDEPEHHNLLFYITYRRLG